MLFCSVLSSLALPSLLPPLIKEIEMAAIFIAGEERKRFHHHRVFEREGARIHFSRGRTDGSLGGFLAASLWRSPRG